MQTFLPYPGFAESCSVLDTRRLGKQRVESYQILRALMGESRGWANHPATRMWSGYDRALRNYLRENIVEWIGRGYRNTMAIPDHDPDAPLPPWIGRVDLHASHRSNLLRKEPEYYGRFGWSEPPDLPYVWPT
jgi:hypothetical protein